jgi:hypothetical protein
MKVEEVNDEGDENEAMHGTGADVETVSKSQSMKERG